MLCLLLAVGRVETPELDQQRDVLIDKILSGEERDATHAAFLKLLAERDARVATSCAARARAERERAQRQAWREQWRQSADEAATSFCRWDLGGAPLDKERSRVEWGQVSRIEKIQVVSPRPLEPDAEWTAYEVQGQARRLRFHGEDFSRHGQPPFQAEVGAWVALCVAPATRTSGLPAGWTEHFYPRGVAVRVAGPPKIAALAKLKPTHLSSTDLFWAVRRAKWPLAPGKRALLAVELERALGGDRFEIDAEQGQRAELVVPEALRRGVALEPGRVVWVVVGPAEIDLQAKRLRLTALALEEALFTEAP